MRIGIPCETKTMEGRVALIPAAAADLVRRGHEVFIQSGAGLKSGFADEAYAREGITVVADAAALYGAGELIVKVKEPIAGDLALLQKRHLLFCYLHLAAEPGLTRHLLDIGLTAVAFESVTENGLLPLLLPMSVIAGRIATQLGTTLLHRPQGGKGKLLGGMASTPRGKVVVLGAGAAGGNAAALAAAAGANVVVFDKRHDRLAEMMAMGPNVTALYAYESSVAEEVRDADIVVGAVLIPSARAPHVVSEAMVRTMEPGSVLVDIAIDQGGCFETSHPTSWKEPTYEVHGVTHFCVTNMPGAVPQTSSLAISAAILPYVQRLAAGNEWRRFAPLNSGINVDDGKLVHPALQGML
ncbi:alanine dehydrogenase [Rhodanobacter sp. FW510-R12]|uniref:alanine dehydrogenase n=1 Tax=unclassified Rhodanobacter TaxID=2621553 RepID=UPI0007AA34F9|nr:MULTISPECIES: alanine dehydrogenase [unclassified Rhodanobacter]KZC15343.1 alanine dehydrogenase [Rhodanobacter sp. FW104-R8]KZC25890.1 alanine dehydrogenase [Rhodanobacter sp. FW510-T8]KZC33736.1 alanine dehydrogenase [Rhodanobacter sp. FW510-R10]